MLRGLHRTVISTPDLDRALEFYRDLIGLTLVTKGRWDVGWESADTITNLEGTAARWVMLSAGNTHLEIIEYESPLPVGPDTERPVNHYGITRIGFEVTGIHGMYKRLLAAGVQFQSAPTHQGDFGLVVYARDPDGNIVELLEYPDRYHEEALRLKE